MQYTISARSKPPAVSIQMFVKHHFSHIPIEQIDSFFGFTEYSNLYGGRFFTTHELSRYDIRSMYKLGINYRIPLTNHYASEKEYEENIPFLEKYYRAGNSVIITNDNLAQWIRRDFPDYKIEASVIKNIKTVKKVEKAFKNYDTVILPMSVNNNDQLLLEMPDKDRITLFANAGCALTCPSRICYTSVSKANKVLDSSLHRCSQNLKERDILGMIDFDLDHLKSLGFERFKLLRSKPSNLTGF
jgi:hypothetical protein